MTPDRLRACLASLGWSIRELARRLGMSETLVRRRGWLDAEGTIPPAVAAWLERIVRTIEANPHPLGWVVEKRRPGRPRRQPAE
jgi:hypothetical protein